MSVCYELKMLVVCSFFDFLLSKIITSGIKFNTCGFLLGSICVVP